MTLFFWRNPVRKLLCHMTTRFLLLSSTSFFGVVAASCFCLFRCSHFYSCMQPRIMIIVCVAFCQIVKGCPFLYTLFDCVGSYRFALHAFEHVVSSKQTSMVPYILQDYTAQSNYNAVEDRLCFSSLYSGNEKVTLQFESELWNQLLSQLEPSSAMPSSVLQF